MRDYAKLFESMTKAALLNEGACCERLPDQMSGRAGSTNPCDFIAYLKPNMFYVECKSCQVDVFDIKGRISENQWTSLLDRSRYKGVYSGYIIWFVGTGIRWVTARRLEKFYKKKKSFTFDELCSMSVEVPYVVGPKSITIVDLIPAIKKGK